MRKRMATVLIVLFIPAVSVFAEPPNYTSFSYISQSKLTTILCADSLLISDCEDGQLTITNYGNEKECLAWFNNTKSEFDPTRTSYPFTLSLSTSTSFIPPSKCIVDCINPETEIHLKLDQLDPLTNGLIQVKEAHIIAQTNYKQYQNVIDKARTDYCKTHNCIGF